MWVETTASEEIGIGRGGRALRGLKRLSRALRTGWRIFVREVAAGVEEIAPSVRETPGQLSGNPKRINALRYIAISDDYKIIALRIRVTYSDDSDYFGVFNVRQPSCRKDYHRCGDAIVHYSG